MDATGGCNSSGCLRVTRPGVSSVDQPHEQKNVMRQPIHVKLYPPHKPRREAAFATSVCKTPDEVIRQHLVGDRRISLFRAALWARNTSCLFATQCRPRYFQSREKIQESRQRERMEDYRVCSRLPTLLSAFVWALQHFSFTFRSALDSLILFFPYK